MLPFQPRFRSGEPVYGAVVFAVKKAIVSGAIRPGDAFPSVRALSQELRINPNTAHKIIAELTRDGLLEVRPGIGTVIAEGNPATREQRRELLEDDVERLVVDARQLGLEEDEVLGAIRSKWNEFLQNQK
jgi:GntR family transcriptional regulator